MKTSRELYQELVFEAEKLGREIWVETGQMPPQQNMMFVALTVRIEKLSFVLSLKEPPNEPA
jgi:hypothetical protein